MSEERERYVANRGTTNLSEAIELIRAHRGYVNAGRIANDVNRAFAEGLATDSPSPPPPPSPTAMAASDMMEELGFSWFARALRGEVELPQNVRLILAEGPVDYAQWSRSIFESMASRLGMPGAWLHGDANSVAHLLTELARR